MNQDLFIETFVSELQSPSNSYSCLNSSSDSSSITHHSHRAEIGKNTTTINGRRRRRRMATKSHWLEIQFDDSASNSSHSRSATATASSGDNIKIKSHQLPYCVEGHNEGSGGGSISLSVITQQTAQNKGGGTRLDREEKIHQERQCLAHSFLPIGGIESGNGSNNSDSFFLEVFAVKATPLPLSIDDTRHSTVHSTAATYSSSSRVVNSSNNINGGGGAAATVDTNNLSSATTLDKKKDDSGMVSVLDNNTFYLVLRGYLPLSKDNWTDEDDKDDEDKGISSHKKRRNKDKKKQCNFSSVVPIPYKPVLVKLFKLGYSNDSNLDDGGNDSGKSNDLMENLSVGLFVGHDVTLKCYQISKEILKGCKKSPNTVQDNNESTKQSRMGSLIMKERKLFVASEFSSPPYQEDFISSLLQNSSVNQPVTSWSNNPLHFPSPVTAIDTIQLNEKDRNGDDIVVNYVAVGCENGTIRIISYSNALAHSEEETVSHRHHNHHRHHEDHKNSDDDKRSALHVFRTSEFLVDGHVLVANFNISLVNNCLSLIIGSSCGFACSFHKFLEKDAAFQQNPQIIVQGLWNVKKKHDDHILSVCVCGNVGFGSGESIAIGTMSGRVLLFVRQVNYWQIGASEYKCIWHVKLYHPVHSVSYIFDQYGFPALIVVTQKTIHLFNIHINAHVKKVKQRLTDLIDHYQHRAINTVKY